jgi:hypothetical protein
MGNRWHVKCFGRGKQGLCIYFTGKTVRYELYPREGTMDIARLQEKLGTIPDPRQPGRNLRHKLEDILVIGLAALLCNGEDFEDMEDFGLEREAE